MGKLKVVLLGSLPKGDQERKSWVDWKAEYVTRLKQAFPEVIILHGDAISDNAGPELVVGHDLWLVREADMVIVNAETKVGAGTAQEMVLAKHFGKPVVTVLPKDSHHRRSGVTFHGVTLEEWIHPFLVLASDCIAQDIGEAVVWIDRYLQGGQQQPVKSLTVFTEAITAFEQKLPDLVQRYRLEK